MKYIASAVLAAALLAPAYGAVAAAPSNLALDKPVSASSSQNRNRDAEFAVDGNVGTRWSSDFSDGNWIIVDLESVYDISSVILQWETAYPEQYNLEVSLDGSNWETVSAVTSSNGGVDSFAMTRSARYVRVESVKRATKWGVSLWELEVYGVEPEPEPEPETEPESTTDSETTSGDGANLALNQTMFASSSENSSRLPEEAVDGDMNSRWASEYGEDQWIAVDLGATYDLSSLVLRWEVAHAEAYDIQVSTDANDWQTVQSVTNSDGGEDVVELSATGRYVRIQSVQRATRWGISLWELEVYGAEPYVAPEPQLVSEGRPATASSTERDAYAPENAFDGSGSTRWASVYGDTAWLQVDLGEAHQVTGVNLDWETAYSSEYQIQTSYDGQSWTTVEHIVDGNGGTDELVVDGHGRYVRMMGLARATSWGHSLWEMQVFGYPTDSADSPSDGTDGSTDDGTGSET
ncbi:discoidin domain-containing protein, partial [Marinimicrobium sp. UBA4209]